MKPLVIAVLFLFMGLHYGWSQDSAVLISAKMFDREQKILVSTIDGWIFKAGNDSLWANKEINTSGWERLNPPKLSAKLADSTGRVEGWFRFKFTLSNDFGDTRLSFLRGSWAATDVYINGNFFASFGNTNEDSKNYREYNPIYRLSVPIHLETREENVVALHFVDYLAPLSFGLLKSATVGGIRYETQGLRSLFILTGPGYNSTVTKISREILRYRIVWVSVTVLLALLFWLLVFQNTTAERQTVILIAVYTTCSALSNASRFGFENSNIPFVNCRINDVVYNICTWAVLVLTFMITQKVLKFEVGRSLRLFFIAFSALGAFCVFSNFFAPLIRGAGIGSFLFYSYIFVSSRKQIHGAQWAIVVGLSLSLLFAAAGGISTLTGYYFHYWPIFLTGVYFALPFSLLAYVSIRFKEIITEVKEKSSQVIQMTEEKEEQLLKQQKIHKELLELEAQALRAQMNPHFIYNCMNSIKVLIQNDDKFRSIEYLTTFSKLIRTLFNNSDKRQISLHDEIETCKLYTQLEAMRLNGKLKYAFDIDPNLDLKSLMVPALIVQPFIENAIWHGIVPNKCGIINISVKGNEESIVCEVDDDGIGREKSRLNKPITPVIHESKGVYLSQQRLNLEKMLNDTNASIEIIDKYDDKTPMGTKVILNFNLN